MTMKTPEEILRMVVGPIIHDDCETDRVLVAVEIALAEGRRAGLEEAAKAQCGYCKDGYPLEPDGSNHQNGDFLPFCRSWGIRKLMEPRT